MDAGSGGSHPSTPGLTGSEQRGANTNTIYIREQPRRAGVLGRVSRGLVGTLLLISLLMNFYLGAFFASAVSGPRESTYLDGDQENRIVILPIEGMIDDDTAKFVHTALTKLRDNPPKGIVLRVSSGGGGVSASDRIWHDLIAFKDEFDVPIVASFGTMAASGGYYVAAPADKILAEPTTITGSIGVIAQAFTVQDLLQKVGVQPEIIAATDATKKDLLNPMRAWTDTDRDTLRMILDDAYERFVEIVAAGRTSLTIEEVREIATGEVFTSAQALENKLVDAEGYMGDAIDAVKELAGIPSDVDPLVTKISQSTRFSWLGGMGGAIDAPIMISAHNIRRWIGELETPRFEYRVTR